MPSRWLVPGIALAAGIACNAHADSSTARLASYYDRHLAICAGDAFEWTGDAEPAQVMRGVAQVGVGRSDSYALAGDGRLYAWTGNSADAVVLAEGVVSFAAGSSGVLAIRKDGSLWRVERADSRASGRGRADIVPVARDVKAASVGDGTDYYVTANGDLYAQGNAHRGQYGDGRLESTSTFVRVAGGVREVRSHTGHAILLDDRGQVRGTGGNIHGPLGRHGLGDKAVRWGAILDSATGIATGASHSLALRADGTLWIWGRNESPEPRFVLGNVVGAAAGSDGSIALTHDGSLWQWKTGARPRRLRDCGP